MIVHNGRRTDKIIRVALYVIDDVSSHEHDIILLSYLNQDKYEKLKMIFLMRAMSEIFEQNI